MAEEIAGILGIKVEAISRIIQYLAILIGIIAFLLFFALSPIHALMLSGFLVLLVSIYFNSDKGIYVGALLTATGFAAIFIPQFTEQLSAFARALRELLVY